MNTSAALSAVSSTLISGSGGFARSESGGGATSTALLAYLGGASRSSSIALMFTLAMPFRVSLTVATDGIATETRRPPASNIFESSLKHSVSAR